MPNERRRRSHTRPITIRPRDARAALLDQLAQWRATRPDLVQLQLIEIQTADRLDVNAAAIAGWRAEQLDDAGLRDLLDAIATLAAAAP